MLKCRKCGCQIENRLAHQSLYDIEDALSGECKPIQLRHKVRMAGPLCDVCLSEWQAARKQPPVEPPKAAVVVPDVRSRAIRELDAACNRLAAEVRPGID